MRIRSKHIVVVVVACIFAFVVFVVLRTPSQAVPEGASPGTESPDEFLAEARTLSETAPAPENPVGSLPGINDDPANVPVIEVETTTYDIGTVPNDKDGHGSFQIHNRGRAPLRITDIRTSCACTTGKMERGGDVILPGASAAVEVTIEPRRIPGFHSQKTLTIFSNDPATPQVAVDVIAKVDPEFEIVPEELDFGAVNKGDTPSATVLLRQVREKPVKVTQVEPYGGDTFKDVTYSFSERPESAWARPDRAEYEIQVTLTGTISPGPFTRYFNILTNVDRLPFIRVPVTGTINSFYAVDPQYPQRLMLQAGEGGKYQGVARISADRPFTVEDLEYNASKIAVEVVPGGDAQHVELQVSIAPGVEKGRIEEEVSFQIRTTDGEFPDRIMARGFVID